MTLSVKHTFTSPKADGTDSTLIQPSNWNAEHTITAAAGKVLGRDTSGTGSVQELPLAFDPTMQSMVPPTGTTAQRPVTATAGMLRYNTDLAKVELYNGTSWGSVGGGAAISDSGPANPQPGDLWWKSDEGQLYVYYNDGTSSQWVIANAFMGGTAFGDITVTSINSGPLAGSRNRIINGDMRIDQRSAGAAVSVAIGDGVTFVPDRWRFQKSVASYGLTVQQSSVAPPGFTNSLLLTVSSAFVSPGVNDYLTVGQKIEGLNYDDMQFGTAGAKTVTVSFWVRSSITGTFPVSLSNANTYNRFYVATFTINAANTWEYKTITIAGDTTGTWGVSSNDALYFRIDLGSGSNFNASSAGVWQGMGFRLASATSLAANNGATFYLTGVQLEVGSQATPFERRNYQTEMTLCKRYFQYAGFGFDWPAGANLFTGAAWNYTMRAQPSLISTTYSLSSNINTSTGVNGVNPFNGYGAATEQLGYQMVAASGARAYAWGYCALSAEL